MEFWRKQTSCLSYLWVCAGRGRGEGVSETGDRAFRCDGLEALDQHFEDNHPSNGSSGLRASVARSLSRMVSAEGS